MFDSVNRVSTDFVARRYWRCWTSPNISSQYEAQRSVPSSIDLISGSLRLTWQNANAGVQMAVLASCIAREREGKPQEEVRHRTFLLLRLEEASATRISKGGSPKRVSLMSSVNNEGVAARMSLLHADFDSGSMRLSLCSQKLIAVLPAMMHGAKWP